MTQGTVNLELFAKLDKELAEIERKVRLECKARSYEESLKYYNFVDEIRKAGYFVHGIVACGKDNGLVYVLDHLVLTLFSLYKAYAYMEGIREIVTEDVVQRVFACLNLARKEYDNLMETLDKTLEMCYNNTRK